MHRLKDDKDSAPLAVFSRKNSDLPNVKCIIKLDASSVIDGDNGGEASRTVLIHKPQLSMRSCSESICFGGHPDFPACDW